MEPLRFLVQHVGTKRFESGEMKRDMDFVAIEEPLEIRVRYWFKGAQLTENLALTMRTPGHDRELAIGFLYSEGVLKTDDELVDVRALGGEASNEILVEVSTEVDVEMWRMSRATFVSSSCGVCGKRSLDAIASRSCIQADDKFTVASSLISGLPALLRERQAAFEKTGGLHAAALISPHSEAEAVFEDIGRHNALDKVIGWCFAEHRLPLKNRILFLSSRSSFELVQKAATAGASILATVGSPSSLAIQSARQLGLTLVGFVRNDRFNVYSGEWRIN